MKKHIKTLILLQIFISLTARIAMAGDFSADAMVAEANGLFANGDYKSAFNIYKKTADTFPSYAPAFDGIGNVYLKGKNYNEAYNFYKTAGKFSPEISTYKIHAQKAVYLARINALKEAQNLLYRAKTNSLNKTVLSNYNMICAGEVTQLKYITDDYDDAFLMPANILKSKKNYSKALDLYTKAANTTPQKDRYKVYNNLGLLYMNQNSLNNAIYCFKKAININPGDEYAYNNIGIAYLKQKDYNSAISSLDEAIELNKNYTSALNNRAVLWVISSSAAIDNSITYLKTIIKYEPRNVAAIKLAALFLVQNKQYDEAMLLYKPVLSSTGKNSELSRDYANLLNLKNKN